MGKVKLTKSQAEEIEIIKRAGHPVYWKENGWLIERPESLVGLSFQAYMNAIYKGYEVEPEFEVGEWVKSRHGKGIGKIVKISKQGYHTDFSMIADADDIRHATPQEIATEKTRRWWKESGRGVWELRENDALYDYELDEIVTVSHDYTLRKDIQSKYKVVCFAEDRKDI